MCVQSYFSCYYTAISSYFFFLMIRRPPRATRTDTLFPTRRSSDLNDRDFTGLSIVSKSQNPSQQDQYSQEFRYNYESQRSEEHTSELQSLMRISYAVFCLKKKKTEKAQKYNNKEITTKQIKIQKRNNTQRNTTISNKKI